MDPPKIHLIREGVLIYLILFYLIVGLKRIIVIYLVKLRKKIELSFKISDAKQKRKKSVQESLTWLARSLFGGHGGDAISQGRKQSNSANRLT